jgi:hypothetical protein
MRPSASATWAAKVSTLDGSAMKASAIIAWAWRPRALCAAQAVWR